MLMNKFKLNDNYRICRTQAFTGLDSIDYRISILFFSESWISLQIFHYLYFLILQFLTVRPPPAATGPHSLPLPAATACVELFYIVRQLAVPLRRRYYTRLPNLVLLYQVWYFRRGIYIIGTLLSKYGTFFTYIFNIKYQILGQNILTSSQKN